MPTTKSSAHTEKLRAYTAEEERERLLSHMLTLCDYWSNQRNTEAAATEKRRMEGLCHSILACIDGSTIGFPPMDLVICPHPADKAFNKSKGRNWHKKQVINDNGELAYQFFRVKEKLAGAPKLEEPES